MKCHLCDTPIVIETDPKNCEYVVKEGGRMKIETFDPDDAETHKLDSPEHRKKMKEDPFFKLEHVNRDQLVKKQVLPAPRVHAARNLSLCVRTRAGPDWLCAGTCACA